MRLSSWTIDMKPSFIREILKVTAQPGIISFAGGLPAPELFPVPELAQAFAGPGGAGKPGAAVQPQRG